MAVVAAKANVPQLKLSSQKLPLVQVQAGGGNWFDFWPFNRDPTDVCFRAIREPARMANNRTRKRPLSYTPKLHHHPTAISHRRTPLNIPENRDFQATLPENHSMLHKREVPEVRVGGAPVAANFRRVTPPWRKEHFGVLWKFTPLMPGIGGIPRFAWPHALQNSRVSDQPQPHGFIPLTA